MCGQIMFYEVEAVPVCGQILSGASHGPGFAVSSLIFMLFVMNFKYLKYLFIFILVKHFKSFVFLCFEAKLD